MQRSALRVVFVLGWVFFLTQGSFCGGSGTMVPPVPTPTPIKQTALYVSEGGLNQIAVLDPLSGTQIGTIPVGKTPTKLSFNYYTHSLWVANAGDGTVMKIDTQTNKVVGTAKVGTDPEWVDASNDSSTHDRVFVANDGSNTITELKDEDLSVIATVPTSGSPVTADGYSTMVTDANGKVEFFENVPTSLTASKTFTVINGLQGAAISGIDTAGGYLIYFYTAYDGKVSVYEPVYSSGALASLTSIGTYSLPVGAGQIYGGNNGPIIVNDVTNEVSQIGEGYYSSVRFTTKVGNAPRGACDTLDGSVYVANSGDDTVSMLNSAGNLEQTFKLQAGAHPEDVAFVTNEIRPSPTPAPTPTPTPVSTSTPAPASHLYVANGSGGNVLEYTSPFSASSTPTVNLNIGGNIWGVASDSKYVAVETSSGYIYIFNAPLAPTASPVAQFQAGAQGGQLLFDASGNLYSGDQGKEVLEYSPPFSNTSTPAKVINGTTASFSLAMDYANNLYAGDLGMNQIEVFASPYTGTPVQVPQPGTYGLASYATYLYGADAASGKIDVYNLPLTTSSTAAFTISNTDPHALAADVSTGTLYVGDQQGGKGTGSVDVYSQPLSGSSTAAYSITSGVTEPVQVWIGP